METTTTPLKTIPLGKTDIQITPMGLGAWQWGATYMWGYGREYTDADLRPAFDAALEAGLNFFDTAEFYGRGQSERVLGRFVRESKADVIVATKFMPLPWRLRKSQLLDALRASLNRLGLPRVDLYQIHRPFPPRPVETWADALADAVEAGLTRAVGVSNYNVDQTRKAHVTLAKRGITLASNQIE